jgi:prepilin-type N-terminal cleavage/methylation domain-containing protein
MRRLRGFTLLELILVVIIIGILASLGTVQYTNMVEKSRIAEAKSCLGTLRTLQLVHYQQEGEYSAQVNADAAPGSGDRDIGLNSGLPFDATCTDTNGCTDCYYFWYSCVGGIGTGSGKCTATRCKGAGVGKAPSYKDAYTFDLSIGGQFTEPAL